MKSYNTNNDIKNNSSPIGYTINFGAKDKDLWDWAYSIPNGRFSLVIKDMLRAYFNDDKDYKLPQYEVKNKSNKSFRKSFILGINDEDLYDNILSLEERTVTHTIKRIIRYYAYGQTSFKPTISNIKPADSRITYPTNKNKEKAKMSKIKQSEMHGLINQMNNA